VNDRFDRTFNASRSVCIARIVPCPKNIVILSSRCLSFIIRELGNEDRGIHLPALYRFSDTNERKLFFEQPSERNRRRSARARREARCFYSRGIGTSPNCARLVQSSSANGREMPEEEGTCLPQREKERAKGKAVLPRECASDANSHESVTEAICRAHGELAAGGYDPLPIANARIACKST